MAGTFARDRDSPRVLNRTIIRPAAQQCPQVGLFGGEEAVAQLTVGGEPHPVAAAAERARDAGDDADHRVGADDSPFLGRRVVLSADGIEFEAFPEAVQDLLGADHPVTVPGFLGVQRHRLDEPHAIAVFDGEGDEVCDLVVVDVSHEHGIDFDRGQARGAGSPQPVEHVGEAVAAGDRGEPLGPQSVQADVHPAQTGVAQCGRAAGQPDAVGGEGKVKARVEAVQAGDEPRQPAAKQGFTARQPDLGDAQTTDGYPHQADHLVVGEHLGPRQPGKALGRHAVGAPQVAPVGERDAQIRVHPAEPVGEWGDRQR